ncbi:unnamed protein product [Amaranthus hypochondriacus]
MADSKPNTNTENQNQLLTMAQMEQVLRLFQQMNKTEQTEPTTLDLKVSEKLTYHNYTMWCKLMHIAIDSRGRINHIIAVPLKSTDPNYRQWKQRDSTVLSGIITNIDSELVNQFLDYSAAYDLWRGIETLLGSGRDELQIFDLNTKANAIKQNNDIVESYFMKLNTIWKEIDRRMPNPMKHDEDITIFNNYIQTQRLYQFLAGLDDSLDKERRDLLNPVPLPTLDMAYAAIQREILRRGIMNHTSSSGQNPSEIGCGLIAHRRSERSSLRQEDRTNLKCSYCGGSRHTNDECFKLIGYPEWWEDLQKWKGATKAPVNQAGGKALFSTADPTGNEEDNNGGFLWDSNNGG